MSASFIKKEAAMSNSETKKSLAAIFVVLLIGWFLGLGTGWKLWQTPPPIVHVEPKPEIKNHDGSTVLPVVPSQAPKPAQHVPAGSHVESTVSFTVQPSDPQPVLSLPVQPSSSSPIPGPIERPPCPPMTVDLTIYREADGSRRVVVSSPDGKVLKGVHIENEVGPPASKILKNSAGLVTGATAWGDKAIGVYYDRDWKFLRYGGELTKNTYANVGRQGWEVRAKLGINF